MKTFWETSVLGNFVWISSKMRVIFLEHRNGKANENRKYRVKAMFTAVVNVFYHLKFELVLKAFLKVASSYVSREKSGHVELVGLRDRRRVDVVVGAVAVGEADRVARADRREARDETLFLLVDHDRRRLGGRGREIADQVHGHEPQATVLPVYDQQVVADPVVVGGGELRDGALERDAAFDAAGPAAGGDDGQQERDAAHAIA